VDRRYLLGAWSEPEEQQFATPSQGDAWRFVDGIGPWIRVAELAQVFDADLSTRSELVEPVRSFPGDSSKRSVAH
jgi:hypothetical protein